MNNQNKILLLEEDFQLCTALTKALQEAGWPVIPLDSAEKALETVYSTAFDLLIVDISRPRQYDVISPAVIQAQMPAAAAALIITERRGGENPRHFSPQDSLDFLCRPFAVGDVLRKAELLQFRLDQKRRKICREQRLSQLAHWNLAAMLNSCRQHLLNAADYQKIQSACSLARSWGEPLGILSPEKEELEAATALLGIEQCAGLRTQAVLQDGSCPEYIRSLLTNSQNLPALIARLALARFMHPERPLQYPESQRIILEQSLAALPNIPSQTTSLSPERRLLDFGLVLLQAGDWTHAVQAFRQVGSQGSLRHQVDALLGLAAAARLARRYTAVSGYVKKAVAAAQILGPAPHAAAQLNGAVCLMRAGSSETLHYLESGRHILQALDLEPELSRATLALATQKDLPEQEILNALKRWEISAAPASVCQDCPWLAPWLLRRHISRTPSPYYSRLLRLAHHCSAPFWEILSDCSQTPALRRCCARLLEDAASGNTAAGAVSLREESEEKPLSHVCEKPGKDYISCPARPLLQVHSLGNVHISAGGCTVNARDWLTSKIRNLLFMLLSSPDGLSEDTIIEEFWPDNWEKGRQNLYTATSSLRRVLKKYFPEQSGLIRRQNGQLLWQNSLPLWYDLREVRRLAAKVHSADSLNAWQSLLSLIQGPFLPDCQQNWAETVRAEITDLQREGLHWLSSYYFHRRQSAESLDYAQRLLALDTTDQPACELALQAHLQLGQTEKAVRLYQHFCANLRRELNAAPNTALIKLYHQARLGLTC